MSTVTVTRRVLAAVLLAAMPTATISAVSTPTPTPGAAAAQHLTNLKTRGNAEIDRRITNLTAALDKLAASTKLTAAAKATLTSQLNAELTGLGALKAKLAADTVLATARTDVQSIITDYRVYALMLPKARLVASADRFDVAEAQLTALSVKLQAKISTAKAAGQDVTAEQAGVTDMNAKIADAQTKTANVVTQLLALQPTDYNANHTVLLTFRTTLAAAQTDLKTARQDAASAISALKALK